MPDDASDRDAALHPSPTEIREQVEEELEEVVRDARDDEAALREVAKPRPE
jgi:hypothetical protein